MPSRKCVVVGCDTFKTDKETLRYRFPKDENTFACWVKRSGNSKLLSMKLEDVFKSYMMCEKHFEQDCKSPGFKKLKTKALPTLLLPGKNNSYIYVISLLRYGFVGRDCNRRHR